MPAAKKPNISFMKSYVRKFINGKMERWEFDLDFNRHFIERYDKMYREDPDFAEAFAFYISERGVDCSDGLSDEDYWNHIHDQWDDLLAAERDGFF